MKLTESLKSLRKSYVYNCYFTIVYDELEEYEKITRVKMAEKVIQTYQSHPELILQILNEEELKFLVKIPKEGYIVPKKETQLAIQVSTTCLARWDFSVRDLLCIPEELWDIVQSMLKTIRWDNVKSNDEENQLKLGLLKVYGALTVEEFVIFCNDYNVYDDFEAPYIRRYCYYKEAFNDDYIIHDEYYEIEDTLLKKIRRNQSKLHMNSKEYLMRIGKENFDFSNTDIQKFYNFVMKFSTTLWEDRTLEEFRHACHLNDINYFIHSVESKYYYSSKNEEYKILFQLAEKAFAYMPSGSLHGRTPSEARNQQLDDCKSCLSEKEVDLFYKVYLGILEYVNEKYQLFPGYKIYQGLSLNPNTIFSLRNKLFENRKHFDEFIKINPFSFDVMELNILRGFKRGIKDNFIVVRHEAEHSILCDSNKVYAIKGLRSTLDEALQGAELPVFVDAVLLPFKNVIIYDGIVAMAGVSMGQNMKDILQNDIKDKKITMKL